MSYQSNILKNSLVIVLLGFTSSSFGMGLSGFSNGNKANGRYYNANGMNPQIQQFIENMSQCKDLTAMINEEKALLDAERAAVKRQHSGWTDEQVNKDPRVVAVQKNLDLIRKKRQQILGIQSTKQGEIGRLIGDRISGGNLGAMSIDGVSDGLANGVIARASVAFGDVINKRVKQSTERFLGGAWDYCEDTAADWMTAVKNVFFHDSKNPIEFEEVQGWQTLVRSSFQQIEKTVNNGMKDSMHSHNMSLRSFGQEDTEEGAEVAEGSVDFNKNFIWKLFISGYVDQFNYYVQVMESRKGYYSKSDETYFLVTALQNRLREFTELMLSATSIKNLDEKLDSNKSIIVELKEHITSLFRRLSEKVKPSGKSNSSSTISTGFDRGGQRQGFGGGFGDNNYPQRFGGWA